jgi:hypothetical protein
MHAVPRFFIQGMVQLSLNYSTIENPARPRHPQRRIALLGTPNFRSSVDFLSSQY